MDGAANGVDEGGDGSAGRRRVVIDGGGRWLVGGGGWKKGHVVELEWALPKDKNGSNWTAFRWVGPRQGDSPKHVVQGQGTPHNTRGRERSGVPSQARGIPQVLPVIE